MENIKAVIYFLLKNNKKTIATSFFCSAILGVILSLFVKPKFESTTIIQTPKETSIIPSLIGGSFGVGLGLGGALSMKDPNAQFIGMLESRTIADSIINKYSLHHKMKSKLMKDTRRALKEMTQISSGLDGLIHITVRESDPILTSNIANEYIIQLNNLLESFNKQGLHSNILVLEKRKLHLTSEIAQLSGKIKGIAKASNLSGISAGLQLKIEGFESTQAKQAYIEDQIKVLQETYSDSHPLIKEKRIQLKNIQSRVTQRSVIAGGDIIDLELEADSISKEIQIRQAELATVTSAIEMARLDISGKTHRVDIVEYAIPADDRYYPRKKKFALKYGLLGMSLFIIGFATYKLKKK